MQMVEVCQNLMRNWRPVIIQSLKPSKEMMAIGLSSLPASSDPHGMSEHIGENEKIRYTYEHMTQLTLDSLLRRFIDVFCKLTLVQFRIKAILSK